MSDHRCFNEHLKHGLQAVLDHWARFRDDKNWQVAVESCDISEGATSFIAEGVNIFDGTDVLDPVVPRIVDELQSRRAPWSVVHTNDIHKAIGRITDDIQRTRYGQLPEPEGFLEEIKSVVIEQAWPFSFAWPAHGGSGPGAKAAVNSDAHSYTTRWEQRVQPGMGLGVELVRLDTCNDDWVYRIEGRATPGAVRSLQETLTRTLAIASLVADPGRMGVVPMGPDGSLENQQTRVRDTSDGKACEVVLKHILFENTEPQNIKHPEHFCAVRWCIWRLTELSMCPRGPVSFAGFISVIEYAVKSKLCGHDKRLDDAAGDISERLGLSVTAGKELRQLFRLRNAVMHEAGCEISIHNLTIARILAHALVHELVKSASMVSGDRDHGVPAHTAMKDAADEILHWGLSGQSYGWKYHLDIDSETLRAIYDDPEDSTE